MSNMYLKVTIEKNWRSEKLVFLNWKNLKKLKSEVWGQKCVWLFFYFNFENYYDVLKPKSACVFLNKFINFNKNEKFDTVLERRTLCFR